MNQEVLHLTYSSSLTNLCEVNSSFDAGVLRIAYHGKNQNKSYISKETFERCLKTIYNCPVVCNYDVEADTIGGHDMELVHSGDGSLRLINITEPIGVIPESAKVFWETVEEDNGDLHEYLCAETLLWKRQPAFAKVKRDGITAQSMELTIKDGKSVDGIYHIDDFEFTAFALLGDCKPCFESASLVFAKQDFKQQLSEMMLELKESYTTVNPSNEDDNTHQTEYSTEGGEKVLDKKQELIEKYGIDVTTLDFSIDDFTVEELTEKFEAMTQAPVVEQPVVSEKFALTSNIVEEICSSLSAIKVQREWGECTRYHYVDCDFEAKEVYCWDSNDWLLYGFPYEFNGDNIDIDFESKKRKKYVIADFDEGEQTSPILGVFSQMEEQLRASADIAAKYQSASDTIASMETELSELRKYKSDIEDTIARGERDEVFAQFEDLVGVEAFETLKADCMKYDLETLEEKCFALRGRQGVSAKFSAEPTTVPKIKIDKEHKEKQPYGGLFEKYGFSEDN